MGERKVISKYYPPDFDPSKITRIKVKKPEFTKVTTMLPMSIRCNTCGEYLGRGTKFNAKKQTVQGEDYLGIKIYRFFIRCKKCAAELTIKTDPKNQEYICEFGATRNYQPWRETEEEKETRIAGEIEEKQDAMKALENRTIESKREMELLEELDELKAKSSRNAEIDFTQLLEMNQRKQEQQQREQELEDEKLVKSIFGNKNKTNTNSDEEEDEENEEDEDDDKEDKEIPITTTTTTNKKPIKRLLDDDSYKFKNLFSTEPNKKLKIEVSNPKPNIIVSIEPEKKEEKPKLTLPLVSYESSDEE